MQQYTSYNIIHTYISYNTYPNNFLSSTHSWFRVILSQRCNVSLVSNTGGLLSMRMIVSPWNYTSYKYPELPMEKDSHNSHTGLRATPLCSLCACWVLSSFGASFFPLGKMGSTWLPRFAEFTEKPPRMAAESGRALRAHASCSRLRHTSREITGHISSAVDLPGRVLLGEWLRNKPCSEGWGLWFCLTDCALTLLFSHLVILWDDSCKWIAAELKSEKSLGTSKGTEPGERGGKRVCIVIVTVTRETNN